MAVSWTPPPLFRRARWRSTPPTRSSCAAIRCAPSIASPTRPRSPASPRQPSRFRCAELGGRAFPSADPTLLPVHGPRLAGSRRPAVPCGGAAPGRSGRGADRRRISARLRGRVSIAASVGWRGSRSAIRRGRSASKRPWRVSALSLLAGDAWKRIRICPNCRWLFLDRSRNSSRLWCDMSVCGNRHKARRHYGAGKMAEGRPSMRRDTVTAWIAGRTGGRSASGRAAKAAARASISRSPESSSSSTIASRRRPISSIS